AIGLEAALEAEGVETLQRGVGNQVHRPAIPARPSVGAAARDEFLAPETDAAVAPVSSDDHDLGLINQHVAPAPATAGRFLTTDDAARRMERREPSVRGLLKAFRRGDAGSGSCRLRPGGAGGRRENADELPHPAAILEPDNPVDEGEQRVVAPQPDVVARLEACPTLADQDGASGDELAAIALDSQSLGVAV